MTMKFNFGEPKIHWNKTEIKRMNQKIETIAKRSSSNTQKASDIVAEFKKRDIHFEKKTIKQFLDDGQIPQFEV